MKTITHIGELHIETERLLLVPTTEKYAQDIFENFDQETTKYMFPKSAEQITETLAWIQDALEKRANGEELQMTFLDKETKEFLGNVGLHEIKTKTPELGIWIKKGAYGKKLWREAVGALVDRANAHLDFEYLIYPVDKDNISSRKIAESFGGIVEKDENGQEKVVSKATLDPDKILNSVMYRIYKK